MMTRYSPFLSATFRTLLCRFTPLRFHRAGFKIKKFTFYHRNLCHVPRLKFYVFNFHKFTLFPYFFVLLISIFSYNHAKAWLYEIEFNDNCPSAFQHKTYSCFNVGEGIVIVKKESNNKDKHIYAIIINSEFQFEFEAHKRMIGGYPDEKSVFFSFGRGRSALEIRCKPNCQASVIENRTIEE